jgi:hypothetical protein
MNKRKLVGGLAVLALIAGALLVCLAPGGFFQQAPENRTVVDTPVVRINVASEDEDQASLSSPGPVAGFVLLGLGAVGLVAAFAMKPQS